MFLHFPFVLFAAFQVSGCECCVFWDILDYKTYLRIQRPVNEINDTQAFNIWPRL